MDPRTGGPIVDENRETLVSGIFACGNVLHVHDLVDYVSEEAEIAGEAAARHTLRQTFDGASSEKNGKTTQLAVTPGNDVRYVLPQRITPGTEVDLYLRVMQPMDVITLSLSGVTLSRKRQVRPSEMLKIRLKAQHWDSLKEAGILQGRELCLAAEPR
ncbi:MAG: hypothetical protein GX855_01250 [Firmicutes bacterium]|nr:hypothetical protein [Bacillota bacterium]